MLNNLISCADFSCLLAFFPREIIAIITTIGIRIWICYVGCCCSHQASHQVEKESADICVLADIPSRQTKGLVGSVHRTERERAKAIFWRLTDQQEPIQGSLANGSLWPEGDLGGVLQQPALISAGSAALLRKIDCWSRGFSKRNSCWPRKMTDRQEIRQQQSFQPAEQLAVNNYRPRRVYEQTSAQVCAEAL